MSVLIFFFFLFTVQSFQSHDGSSNAVYLLSPSVILPTSVMMFTDVSVFLSLHVVNPPSPSLSPKRALLLPQCDTPPLGPFFPYHQSKSVIYHSANFVFHPLPKHSWHKSEPTLYRGCANTTVLYATKQCNTNQAKHSL